MRNTGRIASTARAVYCLRTKPFLRGIILLAALLPRLVNAASEEELFFKGVADVNEGDLRFLSAAPPTPVHHHQNLITVSKESLLSGWVKLEQCHRHLDPVPDLQIVYRQDRIRDIAIVRSENIGRSRVEQNSVQMEQIGRNALICIEAETQALTADGEHRYSLSNGPYMRRFLDGYYPMRVSLRVRMEAPGLRFLDIHPAPQPGFAVSQHAHEVAFEAWFEGELRTRIRFTDAPQ